MLKSSPKRSILWKILAASTFLSGDSLLQGGVALFTRAYDKPFWRNGSPELFSPLHCMSDFSCSAQRFQILRCSFRHSNLFQACEIAEHAGSGRHIHCLCTQCGQRCCIHLKPIAFPSSFCCEFRPTFVRSPSTRSMMRTSIANNLHHCCLAGEDRWS